MVLLRQFASLVCVAIIVLAVASFLPAVRSFLLEVRRFLLAVARFLSSVRRFLNAVRSFLFAVTGFFLTPTPLDYFILRNDRRGERGTEQLFRLVLEIKKSAKAEVFAE